ncbi:MAG: PH domain-containing protein [Planctomycetota bacterium]|nr:PH domain-containing protein [Planctomycetota bacterium]
MKTTGGPGAIELIVGIMISGCSIALLLLAFWLRATVIFGNTGLTVERRFKPPVFLPYEQVDSVASYRIRMRHHGAYLGTAMKLDLRFAPGAAIPRVVTGSTHKEPIVGKSGFSLTQKFETVLQPEDTVAELVATYIAPRLMERIERGETVTIGERISLDRAGLHLRFVLSKRSIPWTQCVGIDLVSDAWQLRLVDGTTVALPGGVQSKNLPALALMAPVLCAGEEPA